MSSIYQQRLMELAEHIGLDSPGLLAQQEIRIGELHIHMQQSGGQAAPEMVLSSRLGAPPAQRLAEVLRTLLQANHLWVGTGGGTLGLSPGGDAITWCVRLPLRELDGAALAALIAGFAELGQAWMQYLAEDQKVEPAPAPVLFQAMRA